MVRTALIGVALALRLSGALAQDTRDLGLPPPSGSQNPVLPPPSGSQNPILPPQSGQRYNPGIGGPFSGSDIPGLAFLCAQAARATRERRSASQPGLGLVAQASQAGEAGQVQLL